MKHPFYALIVPMPTPVDPPDPPTGTPPGFWGPNDPRPSNPIQLPPWAGKPQPPWPGTEPPLGFWGPNDPRPSNPIPIYPGGSPNPPGTGGPPLGMWGPSDGRPTNPIQLPPWAGGPQPPVVIPPGLPDGRDYAIVIMPGSPPISMTPGPGEKPEVPEGGTAVLVWDGAWSWQVTPPPPPGYTPPTGSGAPPNVVTPVKGVK